MNNKKEINTLPYQENLSIAIEKKTLKTWQDACKDTKNLIKSPLVIVFFQCPTRDPFIIKKTKVLFLSKKHFYLLV